jgi:hypothetical protein
MRGLFGCRQRVPGVEALGGSVRAIRISQWVTAYRVGANATGLATRAASRAVHSGRIRSIPNKSSHTRPGSRSAGVAIHSCFQSRLSDNRDLFSRRGGVLQYREALRHAGGAAFDVSINGRT